MSGTTGETSNEIGALHFAQEAAEVQLKSNVMQWKVAPIRSLLRGSDTWSGSKDDAKLCEFIY